MKQRLTFILLFILVSIQVLVAQQGKGFDRNYMFLKSENLIEDKNFYLLTVLSQSKTATRLFAQNEFFNTKFKQNLTLLKEHIGDTCTTTKALFERFKISAEDSILINTNQIALYHANPQVFDELINKHLRPSGYFQLFAEDENLTLLLKAWGQMGVGINNIIDRYGLGKKFPSAAMDSVSYQVDSKFYRAYSKMIFAYLDEKIPKMSLFFQPNLAIAMQLLDGNDRDEPTRHEPMEKKDNRLAYNKIKTTDWKKFKYSAIVVPGNGPDSYIPLSPIGKVRCDLAADRFQKKLAPFIILSGGYCYPFKTPYAEAVEMKKYLIKKYHIAEANIIIEPHARRTFTNFRNANRLIFRYGFPTHQKCLFVTTKDQADYVMGEKNPWNNTVKFNERMMREFGFLHYSNLTRISNHDIEYLPTILSLQMDSRNPLDP